MKEVLFTLLLSLFLINLQAQESERSRWLLELSYTPADLTLNQDDVNETSYDLSGYKHKYSWDIGIRGIYSLCSWLRLGGGLSIESTRMRYFFRTSLPWGYEYDVGDKISTDGLHTILAPTFSGTTYFSFLKKEKFQASVLVGGNFGWTLFKRRKDYNKYVTIPGSTSKAEERLVGPTWSKVDKSESLKAAYSGIRFDYRINNKLNIGFGVQFDFSQVKTTSYYAQWKDFRAYKMAISLPFSLGILL